MAITIRFNIPVREVPKEVPIESVPEEKVAPPIKKQRKPRIKKEKVVKKQIKKSKKK